MAQAYVATLPTTIRPIGLAHEAELAFFQFIEQEEFGLARTALSGGSAVRNSIDTRHAKPTRFRASLLPTEEASTSMRFQCPDACCPVDSFRSAWRAPGREA